MIHNQYNLKSYVTSDEINQEIDQLLKSVELAAERDAEKLMHSHDKIDATKIAQNQDVLRAIKRELPYVRTAESQSTKPKPGKLRRFLAQLLPSALKRPRHTVTRVDQPSELER